MAVEIATAIDHVADWVARLRTRLYTQFREKPKIWQIVSTTLAPQFQELEDAFQQLTTLRSIELSEGAQLDVLGRIVGQVRGAAPTDADYRMMLRARILANRSNGTVPELLAVLRAALDQAGQRVLEVDPVLAFQIAIVGLALNPGGTPGDDGWKVTALLDLLGDARAGGVRGVLEWQPEEDAATFYTHLATTLTANELAGSTTLDVDSTDGFPASGQLRLDDGAATEETVAYTSKTATTFVLSSGTANAHDQRGTVSLIGAENIGQGFDTCAVFTVAATAPESTLTVDSTDGFPSSGQLDLFTAHEGSADGPQVERVTYTSKTGTTFTLSSPTNDYDYGIGDFVRLVGGPGGRLAGALDS